MSSADRLPTPDLPDCPQGRQFEGGVPWLTFNPDSGSEFRHSGLDENLLHIRVNLCLAVVIAMAFTGMDFLVLGPELSRIPSMIHGLVIIPALLVALAWSFSPHSHRIYPRLACLVAPVRGLG